MEVQGSPGEGSEIRYALCKILRHSHDDKRAWDISPISSSALRTLGAAYVPI